MFEDCDELIAEFVVESQEGLAEIESDLLAIEENGANIDVDLVNKVFRTVHSIKGASGFMGLETIGALSHSAENVLSLMRNEELVPTPEIVEALLKASDSLREMVNDAVNSNGVDVSHHVNLLTAIASGKATVTENTNATTNVDNEKADNSKPGHDLIANICPEKLAECRQSGNEIFLLTFNLLATTESSRDPLEFIQRIGEISELLSGRIDFESLPELSSDAPERLPYFALVSSSIDAETLQHFWQLSEENVERISLPSPETIIEETAVAETVVAETAVVENVSQPEPAKQQPAEKTTTEKNNTARKTATAAPIAADANIRVSVSVLDKLMNLAGELVLGRNQLLQNISNQDMRALDSDGARIDQITSELQETIMETRMQPIGTVFNKFTRVVRDLSSTLNKQCDLIIEGKEVELDKTIIEAIGDPLTHLIRNSVDHGIEMPAVREKNGKQSNGTVILKAFHQEGKVNICIRDDGAGIDHNRLKQKAVEKGLITEEQAGSMSRREAVRLIFHPGFSMAEEISAVSGRGVGMDVVRTNFEKLGGSVEIETELGKGTTISIALPLTLAIIPSLIVRSADNRFAIPQVNISELVRVRSSDIGSRIEQIKNSELLRLRGDLLPLVRLKQALSLNENGSTNKDNATDENNSTNEKTAKQAINIIVVETGEQRYGLVVDGLNDSEEIVVKPLGRHIQNCQCLSGATVLGDGRVAMILDIAGIANYIDLSGTENPETTQHNNDLLAAHQLADESISALLFTNHPDEQFAIPMNAVARIERIKTAQLEIVAGQETLQYRHETLPILSLEKTVSAQPRDESSTVNIVIFDVGGRELGLVAPKILDIRNLPTSIDSLTFQQPGILGSTIVDDETTRLVDAYGLARAAHPEWFTDNKLKTLNKDEQAPVILLAEDSKFFRTKVTQFLEDEGCEVIACEDGQDAWDKLQEEGERVDLVVTDIEMPNMNGFEFCEHIRQHSTFESIPVIAVTSLASDEHREHGQRVGIDEYLVKLNRDKLVSCVSQTLKRLKKTTKKTAQFV